VNDEIDVLRFLCEQYGSKALTHLSIAQLKSLCEAVGVTKQGKKADVAQRILDGLPALAQQEAAAAADRATNKRKRQEFEAKLASWDGELKTQSRFRLGRDELTAVMPPAQAACRIRGHEFYPKRFNKDGRCRKGFHNMVGGGKQLPWGGHDSYLRTCKVCGHVEFVPES